MNVGYEVQRILQEVQRSQAQANTLAFQRSKFVKEGRYHEGRASAFGEVATELRKLVIEIQGGLK